MREAGGHRGGEVIEITYERDPEDPGEQRGYGPRERIIMRDGCSGAEEESAGYKDPDTSIDRAARDYQPE